MMPQRLNEIAVLLIFSERDCKELARYSRAVRAEVSQDPSFGEVSLQRFEKAAADYEARAAKCRQAAIELQGFSASLRVSGQGRGDRS